MGMRLFAEPHFLDQRPGFGFVAAEAHVEFHRMLGTALRKDILTERAGDLAVEDALFLEEREGVRLQHFGPLVAVIPRGIAAPRRYVRMPGPSPFRELRAAPASGPSMRPRTARRRPRKAR